MPSSSCAGACRAVTVDDLGGIEVERPLRTIAGMHSGRKRQARADGAAKR